MSFIDIGGPWFEDLEPGLEFDAPAVTLTAGHAATYQALCGDRLRLPLDHDASRRVTRAIHPLAHPLVVFNVAIGQTTWATQRVRANLAYRGYRLLRPAFLGDTLHTVTRVAAARQNASRPGRAATGVVALESTTVNQHGERVMHGWRFPMIPCRDPAAETGRADELDALGDPVDAGALLAGLPDWNVGAFRRARGGSTATASPGCTFRIASVDTVTAAPEWVRLTLNMAAAHVDSHATPAGRRLVYGGHTIAIAFAQVTRALPDLLTMLAWERCDHVGPVGEGERLRTELDVLAIHEAPSGTVQRLRARTYALGEDASPERHVLDWAFHVWSA